MSLPLRQTINGVIDSIVHVCEQYLTTCTRTPLPPSLPSLDADVQDRYAKALLLVLMENVLSFFLPLSGSKSVRIAF